jgi:hypothetical protein
MFFPYPVLVSAESLIGESLPNVLPTQRSNQGEGHRLLAQGKGTVAQGEGAVARGEAVAAEEGCGAGQR